MIPVVIITLGYLAICVLFWLFADDYEKGIYEDYIFSPDYEELDEKKKTISKSLKTDSPQNKFITKEINIRFQTDLKVNYLNSKFFNKVDCYDLSTRKFRIFKEPLNKNIDKSTEKTPETSKITFKELIKGADCYKYYLKEGEHEMKSDFIYNPKTKYHFYSYYEKEPNPRYRPR